MGCSYCESLGYTVRSGLAISYYIVKKVREIYAICSQQGISLGFEV